MRWSVVLSAVALLLGAGSSMASAPVRVGVVAFEVEGDSGHGLADRLADKLATRPVDRVVSPADMKADAVADPRSRQVRTWAATADVDAVVVGRVSPPAGGGDQDLRLAVEVRSGNSGGSLSAYRAAVAPGAAGDKALDDLAGSILAGLGYRPGDGGPAKASLGGGENGSGANLAIEGFKKDEPISIKSEELEVITLDDGRRVIFDGNVRVVQGDIKLRAEHMEAVYTKGESKPSQLSASGKVTVTQGSKMARCDEGIYDQASKTITCVGNARLTQDCDVVRGQKIRFDIDGQGVRVIGAASVELDPKCEGAEP